MTDDSVPIDQLLATALRGQDAAWPPHWSGGDQAIQMIERIAYHGVAGLIAELAATLADWPPTVLAWAREHGIALAMWELRHRQLLGDLLAALAKEGVVALLLKGTALAYDLYSSPATRARGDSDLLIAPADLDAARSVLARLGYRCHPLDEGVADDLALQEVWSLTCGAGTQHDIDLHWQLLNAPALREVLDFASCAADPHPLPRLAPDALAMNRELTLLHTCVHRAMHLTSPYFVDGITYYGGDRLIWAKDIHLLAGALTTAEWQEFSKAALSQGVASVCLDGLRLAKRELSTEIPAHVLDALGAARLEQASAYLLGTRQLGRAWRDLLAIPDWRRKLTYLAMRAFPSATFVRRKYPAMARMPLSLLYARRMIDLIRRRPDKHKR